LITKSQPPSQKKGYSKELFYFVDNIRAFKLKIFQKKKINKTLIV